MNTNYSDQSQQILGYPKYTTSHNIDLSKIVTLSALVEPDSNLSKLKEKIERLKFQIAGQQQEIFLLKKSKLRFSNSIALNEEVQLVKKINSDLRAKVLELSKSTRDYEVKLQTSIIETSHTEEKLRSVLQENIELKLQIYNNKNAERISRTNLMEQDKLSLANEIKDLKQQVSLMRDHFEKSLISLTPNSRLNIINNNNPNSNNNINNNNNSSIPKWSIQKVNNDINYGNNNNNNNAGSSSTWSTKLSQIQKSEIYEKLKNPLARPKKICGRLINKHLNKDNSDTICCNIKSSQLSKTSSKKSDNSSMKSDSTDDTSEETSSSSASSASQSNQSNLSDKRSINLSDEDDNHSSNTSNTNSTPTIISNNDNQSNNNNNNNNDNIILKNDDDDNEKIDEQFIDTTNLQIINDKESIEQINEKLQQTTNLLIDLQSSSLPCTTCEVKNFVEKIIYTDVD